MYASINSPKNETRLFGVVASVVLTAVVGFAFANSMNRSATAPVDTVTTVSVLPAPSQTDTPEIPDPVTNEPEVKLEPTITFAPRPIWEPENQPDSPIRVDASDSTPTPPIARPPTLPRGADVRPRLIVNSRPDYPNASIRNKEEGVSVLDVCVSASGRTTSAALAVSSGHPRLDDAALKWVRAARFEPGRVDGKPQAICNHQVEYIWELRNAG